MAVTVEVIPESFGGFLVHKWLLWVGERYFFLGQDLKVCDRLLGRDPVAVAREVATACGLEACDLRRKDCRDALGAIILDAVGGEEALEGLAPWELGVE